MDKHRTALVLFAVALGVVIVVASVTTVEQVKAQKVSADAASGTTGLSKPYPPLAPGEPILKDRWLPSPGSGLTSCPYYRPSACQAIADALVAHLSLKVGTEYVLVELGSGIIVVHTVDYVLLGVRKTAG